MSRIGIVVVLLAASMSAAFAGQSGESNQSVTERRFVPGAISVANGSPVELAESGYTVENLSGTPYRSRIVEPRVTIKNVAGRAIRRLSLVFITGPSSGCGGMGLWYGAEDGIATGETRVAQEKAIIQYVSASPDFTLDVVVMGAQFEDGTFWAAARERARPLLINYLQQPTSYLSIKGVDWTDKGYRANLQVGNARVVAYRLGIVRDTPQSFEVRIGKWIELDDEQANRRVVFTDESNSLEPEQIFEREAYTRCAPLGKAITDWGGVAVFVAETKFADGRTWRQDLTRDGLFWNN